MRTSEQLSVTLPKEMARMIRNKVASGEYASESEVIRDGLRALQAESVLLKPGLGPKLWQRMTTLEPTHPPFSAAPRFAPG